MPTLLIWQGHKFRFYALDIGEPPHIHVVKDGKSLKVWLESLEVAANRGYNDRETARLMTVIAETGTIGLVSGMASLTFETDEMRPTKAWCTKDEVHVALADGRTISAPLWWYPFLARLDHAQLDDIELMYEGIWWPAVDEGISVKSMFMGRKMPNAVPPPVAAE